ncbi:reverse transcriptase domain-containing protein [Mucilaginibacter sp. PAMB04168]|uniref:reverse transcriptase domain-containing protein n=1 Tax=Mucilaginibacter sp. PAMB04168 TaxID=3138567 RepID=UPI0031F6095E
MPFDQDVWEEFEVKARTSFPKRYTHFDRPFDVEKGLIKLKNLLKDPSGKGIARHPFFPFLKIFIKTPRYRYQDELSSYGLDTKERPISFAAHFDALIFTYFDLMLKRKYQQYIRGKGFSECVLAYRDDLDGKCNIQFAKEIFDQISEKCKTGGAYTAIGFDIKGYFDTIPHAELKRHWQTVLETPKMDENTFAVFKALTTYSYAAANSLKKHFNFDKIERGKSLLDIMPYTLTGGRQVHEKFGYLRRMNLVACNNSFLENSAQDHPLGIGQIPRGIPQGSAISSTLSNVYLLEFDKHMHNLCSTMQSVYRRYCDDILIICKTKDVDYLRDRLCQQLDYHGLKIQKDKTEVIDFRKTYKKVVAFDGSENAVKGKRKKLQYLGFEFDGERVYIRPGSLSRYFRKMKAGIRNTVLKAYGKRSDTTKILTKDLLAKYAHTGRNNFISYAYRAASESYGSGINIKEGFNSPAIKRQLSRHFTILQSELNKENEQRYALKLKEALWRQASNKTVKMVAKRKLI